MNWDIVIGFLQVLGWIAGVVAALFLLVVLVMWPSWRLRNRNDTMSEFGGWWEETMGYTFIRGSFLWWLVCKPIPWYGVIGVVAITLATALFGFAVTREVGDVLFNISRIFAVFASIILVGMLASCMDCGGGGGIGDMS